MNSLPTTYNNTAYSKLLGIHHPPPQWNAYLIVLVGKAFMGGGGVLLVWTPFDPRFKIGLLHVEFFSES